MSHSSLSSVPDAPALPISWTASRGVDPVQSLYLHVPFCNGKCAYCAFYSEPVQPGKVAAWLAALQQEARTVSAQQRVRLETIYIGGGTPSVLSGETWRNLDACLRQTFDLAYCREWTVECNPGTVTPAILAQWRKMGVTRISLGVQAWQAAMLKRMNRRHSVQDVTDTVQLIRAASSLDIGIDLIAAYPGVTRQQWIETLQRSLELCPDHLSVYACSVEPGTRLAQACHNRQIRAVPQTTQVKRLADADKLAQAAGYEHYEISNYARPGHGCLHNRRVWIGCDYIGLGPAAASRVGLQRWTNHPDLDAYCNHTADAPFPRETELVSPEMDAIERLMFAFRLKEPVRLACYMPDVPLARQHALLAHWQQQLHALQREGLVEPVPGGWHATPTGWLHADHIARSLLPA